jgi:drug/metabolite transporter (DMT)-like permease
VLNTADVSPIDGVAPIPLGVRDRLAARPDLPLIAGVIAVLVWGVGPLFVTAMSLSPPSLVLYRLWLGAAIMIVMARSTGGTIDLAAVRSTALPGALFGISMIFGFWSFKTTSVANASIIGALTPAFVLVAAGRVFGERCTRAQLIGAFVGFAGVAVVVIGAGKTGGASFTGDALAFVNLVLWAAYLLVAKRIRRDGLHAGAYIAAVFTWAAVIVTPWSLLVSDDLGELGMHDAWLLLGMALSAGLIGHSLMAWAQRDLDVGVVSLLGLASPVVSAIGAWLVNAQPMNGWQVLGSVLVLGGLLVVVLQQRKILVPPFVGERGRSTSPAGP